MTDQILGPHARNLDDPQLDMVPRELRDAHLVALSHARAALREARHQIDRSISDIDILLAQARAS